MTPSPAATGIAQTPRQQYRLETANMVIKTLAKTHGIRLFARGRVYARLGFTGMGEFHFIPADRRQPSVNLEGRVHGVLRCLPGFAQEPEAQRFLRALNAFVRYGKRMDLDTVIKLIKRNTIDRTPKCVESLLVSLLNEYRFAGVFPRPSKTDLDKAL